MPYQLTSYRVFIASPGGLDEERRAFREALADYNDESALIRGVHFQPVGWEATLGGVGRPQSMINEDIEGCDYFVMLLSDRWGSTPVAEGEEGHTSGAEEEYHFAMQCWKSNQHPMRDLVVFFKGIDAAKLRDPGPQLQQVIDFRADLDRTKKVYYQTYDSPGEFVTYLRRHLANWVVAHETGIVPPPVEPFTAMAAARARQPLRGGQVT